MKYKIFLTLSIMFIIISVSAVSAEPSDTLVIGENGDNIDLANIPLSENISGESEDNNPSPENNSNPTNPENPNNQTDNEETPTIYPDGTFQELEKILWRASDGDTIVLDRNYTYDGADRKVISIYRQITIDGNGHTLDAKNGSRIFYIGSEAKNVTLININLINAKIDGAGGAILNDGARLTIINCSFINNRITGSTGGAISSNKANNVVIKDCIFSKNYATGVGGAVYVGGDNTILSNNIFTDNEARDYLGGAVHLLGYYTTITNNTFKNNKAGRDGGAIDVEGKSAGERSQGSVISNNIFIGNSATYGGAVGLNAKDSIIINNTFKSNKATDSKTFGYAGIGGAIRAMCEKNIKIINNTFTDNTAYRQGGALYLTGDNSVIINNTFTNNRATNDAGGSMNVNGNRITISSNVITGSSSKNAGGAIFIKGNNLKILNNVISQSKSTASYGGAIQVRGDASTISGNEFTQNTAKTNGGALYIMSDKAIIKDNTFSKNSASKGLSIYAKGDSPKLTNNLYVGGKSSKTVVWDKITTKLTANAKTFSKSVKTKQYTITLKNDMGNVMKNAKVTLTVNKKTYTVKTNSKGQATFKITNLNKKGKFTAIVKYGGNSYHYSVTKKPVITIK